MVSVNLESVRKAMEKHDKLRESVIILARKIIIRSKTAIGAVHRNELEKAASVLETMKQELADLTKLASKEARLLHEGIFKVAVQEYVEALSLYTFVKSGKFVGYSEEFVEPEHYLLGLCDLSGELVRKAINAAVTDDFQISLRIQKFLEDIYTELSKFDFRNGEIRRKYDGIKYDIKKLDDVVFQLKMKDKL